VVIVGSLINLLIVLSTYKAFSEGRKALIALRLFRVLRVLRLFTVFRELNILMVAFGHALKTVAWVSVMTLSINYMFAVFLTNYVRLMDWGSDADQMMEWFGTLGHAMRTLFIVMTLAQWDEIVITMERHVNPIGLYTVSITYIVVTSFCMVSLITGILSEKLIVAQAEDREHKIARMAEEHDVFCSELREALVSLDADGNGMICLTELKTAPVQDLQRLLIDMHRIADVQMHEEDFMAFVENIGATIGKELPCTGEWEVDIDDLVDALRAVKGPAQATKLWELSFKVHRLEAQVMESNKKLDMLCRHLLGPNGSAV